MVAIGGAIFFGFQLSEEVDQAAPGWEGKEWLLAPMLAAIALLILTIWRNIFISAGVLTRSVEGAPEQVEAVPAKKGGINWIGVILVLVSVGVFRHCTQESTRKLRTERLNKQRQESLENRKKAEERLRNNPRPKNHRFDYQRLREK